MLEVIAPLITISAFLGVCFLLCCKAAKDLDQGKKVSGGIFMGLTFLLIIIGISAGVVGGKIKDGQDCDLVSCEETETKQ